MVVIISSEPYSDESAMASEVVEEKGAAEDSDYGQPGKPYRN
ncbi:hypothetical protein P4S64_06990 [Vibrio sp. M60_M31a]